MRITRLGLAGLLPALAVGCITPRQRVATYTSPELVTEMPDRLVIVPFDGSACTPDGRDIATKSVALELQGIPGCGVITAPPNDERLAAESAVWRRGRVDIAALIAARKRYRADAFLFGTVTQYKAYDPPILGLKLRMLSAQTGDVLWAADALFDAHDQQVRRQARSYFNRSGLSRTLYGSDLIFMSPRLFSRFVASEVVRRLEEQTRHPQLKPNGGK